MGSNTTGRTCTKSQTQLCEASSKIQSPPSRRHTSRERNRRCVAIPFFASQHLFHARTNRTPHKAHAKINRLGLTFSAQPKHDRNSIRCAQEPPLSALQGIDGLALAVAVAANLSNLLNTFVEISLLLKNFAGGLAVKDIARVATNNDFFGGPLWVYEGSERQMLACGLLKSAELPKPKPRSRSKHTKGADFLQTYRLLDGRIRVTLSARIAVSRDASFTTFLRQLTTGGRRDK